MVTKVTVECGYYIWLLKLLLSVVTMVTKVTVECGYYDY